MEAPLQAQIHKNLRFNVFTNLLDGGFFGFALGFASFVTVIPLFVRTMTTSALLIGLVQAIHNVGWQLPQLLTADRVSRLRVYKPMVVLMTIHERVPFLGLALIAWFLPRLGNELGLALTFLMLIWQGLGGGFTATAWQSMIGKIMPSDRIGTFFGAQSAVANLFSSIGAVAAGFVLGRMESPFDFTLCFVVSGILMLISLYFIAQTREPAHTPRHLPGENSHFVEGLKVILWRDSNFRWFLASRMLAQFALMASGFYTVYAVTYLGMDEVDAGWITSVLLITQIVANPIMGWIGDRWNHRVAMEIGAAVSVVAALLAWWSPNATWFYLVYILSGIATAALWTSSLSIIHEFGSDKERPAYIGLANTLVAPMTILAPLLGGVVAQTAGYRAAFIGSALGGLVTWVVLHTLMQDPRKNRLALEESLVEGEIL